MRGGKESDKPLARNVKEEKQNDSRNETTRSHVYNPLLHTGGKVNVIVRSGSLPALLHGDDEMVELAPLV